MKKLTIGSLKYNSIERSLSMNESVSIQKASVSLSKVVSIKQNQRYFQIEIQNGQSILEAALMKNVPLDYKCKKGTCGKCKVQLVDGNLNLQPTNELEERKLRHLIQSGFRLACQARGK